MSLLKSTFDGELLSFIVKALDKIEVTPFVERIQDILFNVYGLSIPDQDVLAVPLRNVFYLETEDLNGQIKKAMTFKPVQRCEDFKGKVDLFQEMPRLPYGFRGIYLKTMYYSSHPLSLIHI